MDQENFLLETETARNLYKAVKDLPIYDYHCHLIPQQIAENRQMPDLTDAWLSGDHYKWRMMRAMGIEEKYITGDATGYEKFLAWARTAENLIGNPLYHWTHLELQRFFNINEPLTEKSAPLIWEKANALLQQPQLSVKGIFEKQNIYAVGTTDDPADSLEHHRAIAEGTAPIGKIKTKVIPSFRPDKALYLNAFDFPQYIASLSQASEVTIKNFDDILTALEKRLDYFIANGCRSSDHGLPYIPKLETVRQKLISVKQTDKAFKKALNGKSVSIEEADTYTTLMLASLGNLYAKKNIVMQLHFSVIRNVNTVQLLKTGINSGFDAVNDRKIAENLVSLFDLMSFYTEANCCTNEVCEHDSGLPKTILYSLNPKDYYPIATIMGGFQDHSCVGKMQLGSAWWFCDHRDGMEEHMRVLANLGMLPAFIGMLTDSRSFLSFVRHEYFRRIMCNLIGKWVENGEYPSDTAKLEKIVKDISFENAKKYFD
ncbi:MAG: glucuronate isomerase [Treponema sp.]|nr:glucuronate isomerase [Treponema sp.]MCL2251319.1 glucuronate isomerase [Treponema sp.]